MRKLKDVFSPLDLIKDQEAVMEHFLGIKVEKGMVECPLRKETHPSCSFWYGKSGELLFRDFGSGETYTITDIIMKKRGVSYVGALDILRRELPLVSQRTEGKKPDKEVLIEVIADVSNEHLWYWQKFGITPQTLSTYMVSSAKSVYTNGSLIMRGTKTNPIFVYPFPSGRLKLYRPLSPSRKGKWYGNAQAEDIGGFKQLRRSGIVCFITSSLKDVMLLREMGFNAICFNSEIVDVNSEIVKRTVKNLKSRFKFVISFMDNDESGMKSNLKLAQTFRLPYIHTVGPKDLSDFYVRYNRKKAWKFIKKSLKRIYVTYKINEGLVPF